MALPDSRRPSTSVTKGVAKDLEDLDHCILSFLQKDNSYMEDKYLNTDRSSMKSFEDYFEDYFQDISIHYFFEGKWEEYDYEKLWDSFNK